MDTVGAWLIHRTRRDRDAKVVGASPDIQALLDQVAANHHPVLVRPDHQRLAPTRALEELA
jgi:phospholipid/cholesterol/gamma-HCH transport system permease protein